MQSVVDTSIEFLKGVGPKRAETFRKEFNIFNFQDLLDYYPFKYIDKSKFYPCRAAAESVNTYIQVKGKITSKKFLGEGRKKRLSAQLSDNSGTIELVWFNNLKYWEETLRPNTVYVVFGKPNLFNNMVNMSHPELRIESETQQDNIAFQPFYNTSEKAKKNGLDSLRVSRLCLQLLQEIKDGIPETLPDYIREKLQLVDRKTALQNIHFPQNPQMLKQATDRLKFEEIFFMQLLMLGLKGAAAEANRGYVMPKVGQLFHQFYQNNLPFALTNAQKRVIKEIRQDFLSGKQMNRLLQGDVGSGKTITALLLMLIAIDNGYQTCLMAPTEILAAQHFKSISKHLQGLNIRVEFLSGSTKSKDRKTLLPAIESGEVQILIGTHALVQDTVLFNRLGLVIIDEQHRFGVEQRAKLWRKNLIPPHVLVMTATPIPRTLSMTLYGDLDLSVIDELPAGRKPILSRHFYQSQRRPLTDLLKSEIAKGRQVYVVFPLIKESETMDFRNLIEGYEAFQLDFPEPKYRISCVHGQLPWQEKEEQMRRFVSGETHIMLATTVIEVGVDVPNASVMVIENAERFGLSQLHQLRGRVGRGAEQSYCLLVTGVKLTTESRKRIEAMTTTNDGFEIAEIDLRLRGPGDMAGTKQSGMLDFKLLNIAADERIIATARKTAQAILQEDPQLLLPKNAVLKTQIAALKNKGKSYYKIG